MSSSKRTLRQTVARCIRWAVAIPLRVTLLLPLTLLGGVFNALSSMFEALSDATQMAQRVLRPITAIPFVLDWERQIAHLKEQERLRILKSLEEANGD